MKLIKLKSYHHQLTYLLSFWNEWIIKSINDMMIFCAYGLMIYLRFCDHPLSFVWGERDIEGWNDFEIDELNEWMSYVLLWSFSFFVCNSSCCISIIYVYKYWEDAGISILLLLFVFPTSNIYLFLKKWNYS